MSLPYYCICRSSSGRPICQATGNRDVKCNWPFDWARSTAIAILEIGNLTVGPFIGHFTLSTGIIWSKLYYEKSDRL